MDEGRRPPNNHIIGLPADPPGPESVEELQRLAERILRGDPRALARGLSVVENGLSGDADLMAAVHTGRRRALRIGITGPPGVGKSTLVDCLASELRRAGKTVGILAIDPSSPFSGGAVLGDRVRMNRHHRDTGVFIRSMASRGQLGGLAPTAGDGIALFEAAGMEVVVVETAGVGQSEVDVVQLAGTVAVVLAPSLGDDIQVAKAGIMEIADVFVLNKADRPGADDLERQLLSMVSLIPRDQRRPPVMRTCALSGEGVAETLATLRTVAANFPQELYWRRFLRERLGRELEGWLASNSGVNLDRAAERIAAGTLNPYVYIRETVRDLQARWVP